MIYVDRMSRRWLRGYGWSWTCRLLADSEPELRAAARALTLPDHAVCQRTERLTCCFLTRDRRAAALALGAVEADGEALTRLRSQQSGQAGQAGNPGERRAA